MRALRGSGYGGADGGVVGEVTVRLPGGPHGDERREIGDLSSVDPHMRVATELETNNSLNKTMQKNGL